MRRTFYIVLPLILLGGLFFFSGGAPDGVYRILPGFFPDPERWWRHSPLDPAAETLARVPPQIVQARAAVQADVKQTLALPGAGQILFGDTHVHTTNSADAFMYSLPLMYGARGAYPPAFACDYARFISQLDFYFLTDHAESFTPRQWQDSIRSVQQCNRLAGEPSSPDLVAFIGWEWTQVGATAGQHYGHHNVLFKDDDPRRLPRRPIAARGAGVATVAARSTDSRLPPDRWHRIRSTPLPPACMPRSSSALPPS